jgi:hypothetical protein
MASCCFEWSSEVYTRYADSKENNTDNSNSSKEDAIFADGDRAMINLSRYLSSIHRLFEYQKQLAPLAFLLAIPTMYYNIWHKYRRQILARYGLTEAQLYSMISTTATRRDGKSTFFQLLVAALALASPPRRHGEYAFGLGIVSINLEASKKMITDIERILQMMPNKPDGIRIHKTATKIIITFPDGRQNIIYGFQTGEVSLTCPSANGFYTR